MNPTQPHSPADCAGECSAHAASAPLDRRATAAVSFPEGVESLFAFPEFGCYLGVTSDGTLIFAPTDAKSGLPDLESVGEVTNVENAADGTDFLATVNAFFGTTFTAEQFAGRR